MEILWHWYGFADLSAADMHEIMAVRQKVFIVEQSCIYQDADHFDHQCCHLLGRDTAGRLCVYARLLPPGSRYREPSIGRMLTVKDFRKRGLGRMAMQLAIKRCRKDFPGWAIRISAQLYLQTFYAELGFRPLDEAYLEDGIAHIDMLLKKEA